MHPAERSYAHLAALLSFLGFAVLLGLVCFVVAPGWTLAILIRQLFGF